MDKRKQEIILGIIFAGIVIFFGLSSDLYSARLDVTENKTFTIHPVSREILNQLPEQLYITYYFTDKLKGVNVVYRQIEDILKEYASTARGKIVLNIVDPIRDNRMQDAREYQIAQFESGLQESPDQANIFVAYSGIVIQYLERFRIIPMVQTVDTLEYDLTGNIRGLVANKIKKVGFLIDKDDFDQSQFSSIAKWLGQYFEVEQVIRGQDISPAIDTLVVIGGTGLTEFDLYPIDQFIMNGGRAFFAVDAVMVNAEYGAAFPITDAPILKLLHAYGVTIEPELIMENDKLAIAVQRRPYHYFFSTYQDFVSKDNPITARFNTVNFFWPSPLTLSPPEGVTAETLISTSPLAVRAKDQLPIAPNEVEMAYTYLSAERASSPIVAALSGTFPSFFKDKPVPQKEGEKRDWSNPVPASRPTRVIVAGDADWLSPRYLSYMQYVNLQFFINSADWLSNDEDLLDIRTRSQRNLIMGKIQDEKIRQTVVYVIIIVNIAGVPLAVILFGIIKYLLRRKKRPQTSADGQK